MTLLQQLVKEVEVYDVEGKECQLADMQVEDNAISARIKTKIEVAEFEFEDRTIDFITTLAEFKIYINIYDEDVTLNERVEIGEIESILSSLTVEDLSEQIANADHLSERLFEFLSDFENAADVHAYVTFASLV